MNKYVLMLATLVVSSANVYGSCQITNARDLFSEIKKNHPKIQQNNNAIRAKEKSIQYLNTWTNPELSLDVARGKDTDGKTKKLGASLMQPIELNGKKRANFNLNKALVQKESVSVEKESEEILVESALKIHKLAQIYRIIPLYKETREAFDKILKNKLQRPSLSPEEEVEKEALILAIRDNDLKVARLENEKDYLKQHISYYAKVDCDLNSQVLPKAVDWSKVNPVSESFQNSQDSLNLKEARLELERAKKNLVLQEKESVSTFKIGPTFEVEELEGKKYNTFGLSLSFDLPLSRQSKYLRQSAQYEISNAAEALKEKEAEEKIDKDLWLKKFSDLKKTLVENKKNNQLEKKHDRIESLFRRGIISTGLVIESHRQLLEFANTHDEFELSALEALWQIHSLEGNVFKADFI